MTDKVAAFVYLEFSQLDSLLRQPETIIPAGYMPKRVADHLGCEVGIAYLSKRSVLHILKKHPDVSLFDMLLIPFILRDGTWFRDKPNHGSVAWRNPDTGKMFKTVVKAAADGFEPYVCSLYRLDDEKFERLLRNKTRL